MKAMPLQTFQKNEICLFMIAFFQVSKSLSFTPDFVGEGGSCPRIPKECDIVGGTCRLPSICDIGLICVFPAMLANFLIVKEFVKSEG